MCVRLILIGFLLCGFISCADDPCTADPNSIDCDSGDFDNDGVLNGNDDDPSDACIPSVPSFEKNAVGTWVYTMFGITGRIALHEDGTYEDIKNQIISNGEIKSRTWRIENERLVFDVENASLMMKWINYDCDSFLLDGEGFIANVNFTRVM